MRELHNSYEGQRLFRVFSVSWPPAQSGFTYHWQLPTDCAGKRPKNKSSQDYDLYR